MIKNMDNLAQSGPIDPRLVSIARVVPHQVGLVKLSKTQMKVLKLMGQGEDVTSEQIARRCSLSNSWSSTTLRRLYERGYLYRRFEPAQAGGGVFIYKRY